MSLLHIFSCIPREIHGSRGAAAPKCAPENFPCAFAAATTIFLPLGFVTGLFGVNLMGLPMEDSPRGFWILTAICLALSLGLLALFRWRKWL